MGKKKKNESAWYGKLPNGRLNRTWNKYVLSDFRGTPLESESNKLHYEVNKIDT